MKKLLVTICVALLSLSASAQIGEQNVGAHLLYGTDMSNIGLGVKYQNNITDVIRIEGVADYYLKKDGFTMFDVNVNGHYLFPLTDKVIAYPLVGINYTHWKQDDSDLQDNFDGNWDVDWSNSAEFEYVEESKDGSIGLNIGGGIQYKLTDKVRIGAELKYQTISGYNTAVIGAGITFTL